MWAGDETYLQDETYLDEGAWQRALTGLYGPVSARADHGEHFRASLRVRELGAVRVSVARCPAGEVRGGPPYDGGARDGSASRYHLVLVLGGALALDQTGRTARIGRRDLVLLDAGRPFRMRSAGAWNEVVTVHLAVTQPQWGLPELVARELPGRAGAARLATEFLAGLGRDTTPYGRCAELRLGTVVNELVLAVLDHRLGDADPAARGPELLARIQAYVLHHLGDGGLNPDRIAAAHHISTRYLHLLFQRQGLTTAAWIKAQRLDRCRRDLADPRLRGLPVHAIGARWGFASPADFSRAFRTAYGTTPTGFRGGGSRRGEPSARVRSLPRNSARSDNDRPAAAQQTHA
ncbi:helix-turn-helix domain-containing protein [Streptomyces spinoverrucosus]|uniref:helix-turn-helix domain-containing protein n=1 Tax=Streptomyces spinoverrucosus TaxID=284043 RepID=UPI0018C428D3|nr:helix-turn-helix domain-containing protein [Streptomyces spinoverrucosus]MBG0853604.1 helix-turn-helix domain-containing protein [Streptomyces spinoverrucosus]